MSNLLIDIGNSSSKAYICDGGGCREVLRAEKLTVADLEGVIEGVEASILCATGAFDSAIEECLRARTRYVRLSHTTRIPIKNLYATPETLGPDRLAAAVGAAAIFPGENVLVVDFGTAITIDMVTAQGEYLGGNISPGVQLRYASLHRGTAHLPFAELPEAAGLCSKNSADAVASGVVCGIVHEVEGYIARYEAVYPGMKVIFGGGDGKYFAKQLKTPIFADHDPVVWGLNSILEFNA